MIKRTGLVFVLLVFLFPFFSADGRDGIIPVHQLLRIGLVRLGTPGTIQFESSTGFVEIFDKQNQVSVYTGKAEKVNVTRKKGLIYLSVDGSIVLKTTGEALVSAVGRAPHVIQIRTSSGKSSYRGSIAIQPRGTGILMVNVVQMEDYLKSVVSSEIWNNGPAAALEAQAIAARTYAIRNMPRHRRDGYNLCDRVHCQVYSGVGRESPKTSKAVEKTAHKVLFHGKTPVNAVYHANCGGVIIDSRAAWGGVAVPYLVAHEDKVEGLPHFCATGNKLKKNKKKVSVVANRPRAVAKALPASTRAKPFKNWGHRVGMCQDGAIGMAAYGYSHAEILAFYYPGTDLIILPGTDPKSPRQPRVIASAPPARPASIVETKPPPMLVKAEPPDSPLRIPSPIPPALRVSSEKRVTPAEVKNFRRKPARMPTLRQTLAEIRNPSLIADPGDTTQVKNPDFIRWFWCTLPPYTSGRSGVYAATRMLFPGSFLIARLIEPVGK